MTSKPRNLDGLKIIPIDESDIQIIEWCPGRDAVNPPEQVHILVEIAGVGFAIRLKTRAGADRFIAALQKHADGVWPRS